MGKKAITSFCAALISLCIIASGCEPVSHVKLKHPDARAEYIDNYVAVGEKVKKQFPEVVRQTEYTWENGYLMGFEVRHGTTKAQAVKIAEYAHPLWVRIREWAGYSKANALGHVFVFDDTGKTLARKETP